MAARLGGEKRVGKPRFLASLGITRRLGLKILLACASGSRVYCSIPDVRPELEIYANSPEFMYVFVEIDSELEP